MDKDLQFYVHIKGIGKRVQKMKFNIKNFFSKWDLIQWELADLVTFTEENLNEKLYFLCSRATQQLNPLSSISSLLNRSQAIFIINSQQFSISIFIIIWRQDNVTMRNSATANLSRYLVCGNQIILLN